MSSLSPTQQRLLRLYKKFKKICNDNNLRFFAVAGTAIGVVRHNGFIPWDDDIDVGMPIKDFEKFKKLIQKHLPLNTGFRKSYWMGGKFYDTNSTIIDVRMLTNPNDYHGVYIDIFPLIGLPNEEIKQQEFINDIKTFSSNAELFELFPKISSFSKQEILNWKNYLLHAYDFEASNKIAAFCYFMLDGKGLKQPIEMPFEDTSMPISSNYDWDLSNHFGDYMTPPPEKNRKTHDEYHLIDLNKPFSQYAKEYQKVKPWLKELLDKNHLIEGKLTQYSNSLSYELAQKEAELEKLKKEFRNGSKNPKIKKSISKLAKKIKKGKK